MSRRNFKQPSSSRSQSHFASQPSVHQKRSRFDRSHGLKTSFGQNGLSVWGETGSMLIPIYVDEVLPGDTFHMKSTAFTRLATPLVPIMDNMFLDVHYFFVPYRLVWDNWQKFMGERVNPDDDPNDYVIPTTNFAPEPADEEPVEINTATLFGLMGLPMLSESVALASTTRVSTLPFRAYRLIWNEWYRDQNLQDSVDVPLGDGPDPAAIPTQLLPRGKRKDYFTSALPWPQKGDPVLIPVELEGYIQVWGTSQGQGSGVQNNNSDQDDTLPFYKKFLQAVGTDIDVLAGGDDNLQGVWENVNNGATINDLRTAFQVQKLLERDARGGTRYIELIYSHFGVQSDDARLQRPEYLGGGSNRITMNPVANTSPSGDTVQGELSAFGTGVNQASFSKSFTEHGIVIGLASYRADLTYQRGIERFWKRQTRYDFYWPALAHLGEQAILNSEINFRGRAGEAAGTNDDDVFGYQERYGEYRYKPSRVCGIFNSDVPTAIDQWHLAQDFPVDQLLELSADFIEERPPIDRIVAVPSEPFFLADIWFDLKCDRPMPTYAIPGFVDHF